MADSLSIKDVAKRAGGYSRLAETAGVKRTTPYRWLRVPAPHAVAIARLIGVEPHVLRPDVFTDPSAMPVPSSAAA